MKLIHWLLVVTFLKQIIFMAAIPLWHGPDEQAHFAQVQYLAEFKRLLHPTGQDMTTSQEILFSERILGTERDAFGKNKFTHHPKYRLESTATTIGKYEFALNHLPVDWRTQLVKQEATVYPPLFYVFGAAFYQTGYHLGLIDRVFLVRLASALMLVPLVWLSYKIGQLLFPRRQSLSLTLAMLVSFQPMLSFLNASVNSDNLMNLLFTLWLYLAVKLITSPKLIPAAALALAVTTIAGLFTKPHFVIVFPLLLLLPFFIKLSPRQLSLTGISFISIMIIHFWPQILRLSQGKSIGFSEVGLPMLTHPSYNIPLTTHFVWTMRHTIAEVTPWYWGVFNWLGVTLPRAVNRVINRLMILSTLGLLIWLTRLFSRRHIRRLADRQTKALIFLGLSAVTFFAVLFLWDWLFTRGHSFSFGMQGRYYFPVISAQMTFLLIGLTSLIPRSWWIKLFGLGIILLNFIGLHTLITAYYRLWPLTVFFNQISQYKPVLLKFPLILIWFILYLASLIVLLIEYLRYADRPRSWF